MTADLDLAKQDLAALYRIRFFEDAVTNLRAKLEIAGSVHLCSGQ